MTSTDTTTPADDPVDLDGNLVDGEPRRLGDTLVGALGFGCWRFTSADVAATTALVEAALDSGCTLVDTADVYGLDWGGTAFGSCEGQLGSVLASTPSLRDRMFLATKGGIRPGVPYHSGHRYLTAACEASLQRLRVDHVDLYQVHRPDPFTHPAAVAETLQSLVDRGLTRYVGVSNYSTAQLAALQHYLGPTLVSMQPELSVAQLDSLADGTLDQAMQHQLAVLAWSPLAGGRIVSGAGLRDELCSVLDQLAGREGVDRATIALAFVLAHPSRPVALLGSQRADRLHAAWAATNVHLSRTDVYRIIEASTAEALP